MLNACDEQGINLCYEIHPSEDLHDGVTFEMFHEHVGHHPRCRVLFDPSHMVLQQLNYLEFIDIYKEVIGMFHVKDAEFNPTGRQGIYGGYQSGSIAPAASARWATARSISTASFHA